MSVPLVSAVIAWMGAHLGAGDEVRAVYRALLDPRSREYRSLYKALAPWARRAQAQRKARP